MAAPAFSNVSTIAAVVADTSSANFPSSIAAGNLLVIGITADAGVTQTVNSFTTPTGFTALTTVGVGTRRAAAAFYKIATGAEVGTLTVALTSSIGAATGAVQMALYSGNYAGLTPLELAATNSGLSTTPSLGSIGATAGTDELAVGIILAGVTAGTTVTAITGMSGGTWSESDAEQTTGNFTIDWQHAALAAAASTISGGTATLGASSAWQTIGFAIKRAGPYYDSNGGGANVAGSGGNFSINVPAPATVNAGDLLIVNFRGSAGSGIGGLLTLGAPPAGWALITGTDKFATCGGGSFWKIAAGTEAGTSPTFTGTYSGASPVASAIMERYLGAATTGTPVESGNGTTGSSTSPAPTSTTSSAAWGLAVFHEGNNGNRDAGLITGNTGGTWAEAYADYLPGAGKVALNTQVALIAVAGTSISGGSCTIPVSARWSTSNFVILAPAGAAPDDMPTSMLCDSSDVAFLFDDSDHPAFTGTDDDTQAGSPDLPEDFPLGVYFEDFQDEAQTDWDDWSWAQAPPIDDVVTAQDFALGYEDGLDTVLALHAEAALDIYTLDWSDEAALGQIDLPQDFALDANEFPAFDDDTFTDWADYGSSHDEQANAPDLPEDFLLAGTSNPGVEDESFADWFEYGTEFEPLIDGQDFILGIDDASAYDDPAFTDWTDYGFHDEQANAPDLPQDFNLGIEYGDFDDPGLTDWSEYGHHDEQANAPDLPQDFALDSNEYPASEDDSQTDWFEYGWQSDPLSADGVIIEDFLLGLSDGTNEADEPSLTDAADYGFASDAVGPDLPQDFVLGIECGDFDDPSQADQTDYGFHDEQANVPDLPQDFALDAGEFPATDDDSGTDWFEYGSQSDPPTPDLPQDFPLGAVDDGTTPTDEPSQTDLSDYGFSQDAVGPDLPQDFALGIEDGALADLIAQFDTAEYGFAQESVGADVIEDFILGIDDASGLDDPSQTDNFDYAPLNDPLGDDAAIEPPIPEPGTGGTGGGGGMRWRGPRSRSGRRSAKAAMAFGDFGGGGGGGGLPPVAEEPGRVALPSVVANDEPKPPEVVDVSPPASSQLVGAAGFGLGDVQPLQFNPSSAALALAQKLKDDAARRLAEELAHEALAKMAHEQIVEAQRKRRNEALALLLNS